MKILVVEDEPISREILENMVRAVSCEVLVAEDGEQGWEIFQSKKPDIVISDIQMPKMNGLELLSAIRSSNDSTIVIIVTSYGREEFALEALHRRANNFLRKPFQPEELLPMLKKYSETIKQRKNKQSTLGCITHREMTIRFPNKLNLVPQMARRVIGEIGSMIPREELLNVHLGLAELIANAIEHGNLEVTCEEKQMANVEDPLGAMEKLMEERMKNPHLAKRLVTVSCRLSSVQCEWTVEDEGKGFDWRSWPKEIESNSLNKISGRGIFLCREFFDHLEFLDPGNKVLVRKKLTPFAAGKTE